MQVTDEEVAQSQALLRRPKVQLGLFRGGRDAIGGVSSLQSSPGRAAGCFAGCPLVGRAVRSDDERTAGKTAGSPPRTAPIVCNRLCHWVVQNMRCCWCCAAHS
ncbi:MAG: hypothetical protein WKG07_48670 [Hymenobacter sp.]